ncbi:porin [Sphingobacterium rhinopitheci]|uniref:porin n=1 Tax=Sphingobacterium rhinopitheci TaxID=2781960 RepID=UPI001F51D15D|nr:porin [Sphingobacterium rhinopitheci]MCI0920950.1 porin [Sphingobacterium rhinopitheci]
MYHKGIIAIVTIALSVNCLCAQNAFSDNPADTVHHHIEEPEETYPKFKVGGLFQARYLYSKKNNVDVEGLQHSDGEFVTNTYEIKRMRVSMNASLTKNLSVVTLVNLADFRQDPKTRVLENAYAQYNVNRYLKYQVGQFRPAFGIEDSHPVDVVKSIDFSNGYYLLGSNGWQSFQVGAGISGSVDLGKVPLNYSASMTNGNGKNKIADNNGKHYSSRFWFEFDPKRKLTLGFSTGFGTEHQQNVHAVGLEGTYRLIFTDKLSIQFQAEAVQAINHSLYFSLAEDMRQGPLKDYVLRDVYILPNLRYVIGKKHLQAVDFSCRYEYLDANYKIDSNPRQTLVPMASVEFLKDYGARLQFGIQIDNYKKNIPNTKTYDANLYFLQFQCRLQ